MVTMILVTLIIGLLLGFSSPAFAENTSSGATLTQSGSTTVVVETGALIRMQIDALKKQIGRPLPTDQSMVFLLDSKQQNWEDEIGQFKQKIGSYRATCRANIRKANRDSIVSQSSACLRGDLMLHIAFLRKQEAYITSLPSLTTEVRLSAALAITHLIDAEMTIVDALDAKLFQTVDDLMNTKDKLLTQYRDPYWLALSRIRADRQLTIIGLMLKRINGSLTEGTSTPLIEKGTLAALSCLTTAATAYQSVLAETDGVNAEKTLSTMNKALPACKDAIWSVGRLKNRQLEQSIENEELQSEAKK